MPWRAFGERWARRRGEVMNDIVTAGILVIGDEILSGRTKDKHIGFIAEYLTNIGIDLKEVRVVATTSSLPPAASGRPMTTSPPTASRKRSASASTIIRKWWRGSRSAGAN